MTLDIFKSGLLGNKIEVKFHNGKKTSKDSLIKLVKLFQEKGAGEIVLNFINNDGMKNGYDFAIIDKIFSSVNVPMTVIGGAGSYDDIRKLFSKYLLIGAGAGSLFVFKGKYKAVLINYPNPAEKESLIKKYYNYETNTAIL